MAREAAMESANSQMRKAGRTHWSRADFDEAWRVLWTLIGEPITDANKHLLAPRQRSIAQ
jgi:hypothetical protein